MKSKIKHDKHMFRNVNNDKYIIPKYINHANKPKHDRHMPTNMNNAKYIAPKYENHAARHALAKTQPKIEKANMINEVRILVSEYARVFDKLEDLGININKIIR